MTMAAAIEGLRQETTRAHDLWREFVRADVDGDGIDELREVHRVGDLILRNVEVADNNIAAWTPVFVPGRVIGLTTADWETDIQAINTALMRNGLDNVRDSSSPLVGAREEAVILAAGKSYGDARFQAGELIERSRWQARRIDLSDRLLDRFDGEARRREAQVIAHYSSVTAQLARRGVLTEKVKFLAAQDPSSAACLLDDGLSLAGEITDDANAAVRAAAQGSADAAGRAAADPAGVHD